MATCGWGQGDWISPSFENKRNVVYSTCRDVVEVPGGTDWRIRRLEEEKPHICWRLPDIFHAAQFHFETVIRRIDDDPSFEMCPSKQSTSSVPLFYGNLTHYYSPADFCIQPRELYRNLKSMESELEKAYEVEAEAFGPSEMLEGFPCAISMGEGEEKEWKRGRIQQIHGNTAFVRLVDKGTDIIVTRDNIKPLLRRFGKLPPLALKCRLKGVLANDLDMSHINLFQQTIESLGRLVRVELATNCEPFHVNLYHPTVEGENLATPYYRPPQHILHEAAKQRKFEEHIRRMNNEESDFEDDDFYDEDEEEEERVEYVKQLERAERVYREVDPQLVAGHVVNSRMLFLHTKKQLEMREEMEEQLGREYPQLPPLPPSWVTVGNACLVPIGGKIVRASIEQVNGEDCKVVHVDYGTCGVSKTSALRVIPSFASSRPFLYVVGLYNLTSYLFPHPTETMILREILASPGIITFELEKGKNNPPRGRLIHDVYGDVNKELKTRLSGLPWVSRFVHPCTTLATPSPIAPLLSHRILSSYEHRLIIPQCLLKGTLALESLPD